MKSSNYLIHIGFIFIIFDLNAITFCNNVSSIIKAINNNPSSPWIAKKCPLINSEIQSILNLRSLPNSSPMPTSTNPESTSSKIFVTSLPESFDPRDDYPSCTLPIVHQRSCGSCWAVAPTRVMSERICRATGARFTPALSYQNILDCTDDRYGCDGGYASKSFQLATTDGIPVDTCQVYRTQRGLCSRTCDDGYLSFQNICGIMQYGIWSWR